MVSELRVGIWGGPGSGKTTYLASLRIATLLDTKGGWNVTGDDHIYSGSRKFLRDNTNTLRRSRFPPPTADAANYAFHVSGQDILAGPLPWQRRTHTASFTLYVTDRPGGAFGQSDDMQDELWLQFSECTSLIYLYDPQLEKEDLKNYDYIQEGFDAIHGIMKRDSKLLEGKLPHNIAVLITKFDDPFVFETIRSSGFLQTGEAGIPEVTNGREAFKALNAALRDNLTLPTLSSTFRDANTRFFFTSSIGFYTDQSGRVDLEDFSNLNPDGTIRGPVVPVNVFAPLRWIAAPSATL